MRRPVRLHGDRELDGDDRGVRGLGAGIGGGRERDDGLVVGDGQDRVLERAHVAPDHARDLELHRLVRLAQGVVDDVDGEGLGGQVGGHGDGEGHVVVVDPASRGGSARDRQAHVDGRRERAGPLEGEGDLGGGFAHRVGRGAPGDDGLVVGDRNHGAGLGADRAPGRAARDGQRARSRSSSTRRPGGRRR